MTAQQLKNSILQMAVQGKLVPQDPNDEPASALLERIRAEKERLIKVKKIKREKNPSVIFKGADNTPYEKIGDEVHPLDTPFDIPESWEWVRHNDLFEISGGSQPPKSKFISEARDGYIRLYQIRDYGNNPVPVYIPISAASKISQKGDILLARYGASLGKVFWAEDGAYNVAMARVIPLYETELISKEFLFLFYQSSLYQSVIHANSRSAQAGFNKEDLSSLLFPLPPRSEQERIVCAYEKLQPFLKAYDDAAHSLATMNKDFPEALKKSILQEAVQGKLVPQDPSDEPAEALLDRIRAEKQLLIKEGKIKKDKHESVIFRRDNSHYEKRGFEEVCIDEEVPFEIPENWSWCRASSLGTMVRGRGIKRTETVAQGCPCIRYGEIYTTYETSFDAAVSFVPESLDKDCLHFSSGDVVFTLTGENKVDIAKTVAFLGDGQIAAGGDLAFWTHHGMNPLYLVYYMASPYCIELKRRTATGDIIVHISTSKVGDFLVPIPPLNEQDRIVSAIERLFAVASTL